MRLSVCCHPRESALDFTKGTLVLLMILYHWLNYFVSVDGAFYSYLRFITPSFIFISGYLIGNKYPERYGWGNRKASLRLIGRGARILVIFTALNLAANMLVSESYKGVMPGLEGFVHEAIVIFGSGNDVHAAFVALVPIGYLLILTAVFFVIPNRAVLIVHLICLAAFLCLGFMQFYGRSSVNCELVAIGLLGVVTGLSRIGIVDYCINHPYILMLLYVSYVIALSIWDAIYVLQVIGVWLSVMLIYSIGSRFHGETWIRGQIDLLGQYSLFGYIAQIGFLQLLHRGMPYLNIGIIAHWTISLTGAILLTIAAVRTIHFSRIKWSTINAVYRAAFS